MFWQRYSDVTEIMEIAFDVNDGFRSAFQSRLSYIRRPQNGCIPPLKQQGKNKLTFYNESALRHIFLAMVLNFHLGMDPKQVGQLYGGRVAENDPSDNKIKNRPLFKVDDWFSEGAKNVTDNLLNSMVLKTPRGPQINTSYTPFCVMFQPVILGDKLTASSLWVVDFDKLKTGPGWNPCSIYLDFTYLSAWLTLAIREWETANQGEQDGNN